MPFVSMVYRIACCAWTFINFRECLVLLWYCLNTAITVCCECRRLRSANLYFPGCINKGDSSVGCGDLNLSASERTDECVTVRPTSTSLALKLTSNWRLPRIVRKLGIGEGATKIKRLCVQTHFRCLRCSILAHRTTAALLCAFFVWAGGV